MEGSEFLHIIAAVIILTLVFSFTPALNSEYELIALILLFSVIVILVSIIAKKVTAHFFDSDIEHEIWKMKHFGFTPRYRLKSPITAGVFFPIILSLLFLGSLKFCAILTYETRALKHRASQRHGFYSFTEMTDWHNGLIGAAGIFALILLSIITYFIPGTNLEFLSKMAAYYAFWNILPISKLDGTQIFFGSRILWAVLFSITSIITVLALFTI